MKNTSYKYLLIFLASFLIGLTADAQERKKRRDRKAEREAVEDSLRNAELIMLRDTSITEKEQSEYRDSPLNETVLDDNEMFSRGKELADATPVMQRDPMKAALYSAILPGLGQIYNRKWWKLPIVYAAIGVPAGFFVWNNTQYNTLRDEYKLRINSGEKSDQFVNYTDEQVLNEMSRFERDRDMSFLFTVLFYALNIVDANVDVHLSGFDISDQVSFEPALIEDYRGYATIGMSFKWDL